MLTQPLCFETGDAFIYAQLMKSFSRSRKDASIALQLFQDMEARGLQPDLVAYNTAITAAGKAFLEGGCAWQDAAVGNVWCLCCSSVTTKPVKQQPRGQRTESAASAAQWHQMACQTELLSAAACCRPHLQLGAGHRSV